MNYYFQVPMHHLSSAPWRGFALHSRNQIGDTERTRPLDEPITPPLRGSRRSRAGTGVLAICLPKNVVGVALRLWSLSLPKGPATADAVGGLQHHTVCKQHY